MDSEKDENRLIAERRRKLTDLRTEGEAFPNAFRRDFLADQLHASFAERSKESLDGEAIAVKVGGRMMAKRVMGKTSFAKLQDRSGQIQLMLERERLGDEAYKRFQGRRFGVTFWVPRACCAKPKPASCQSASTSCICS